MNFDQIMDYCEDNRNVFEELRLHMPKEKSTCIPFIGAGVSAFINPCWKQFLETCALKIHNSEKRQSILDLIEKDYELAADELLNTRGKAGMYADIQMAFNAQRLDGFNSIVEQAVYLFPYLFKGPLLTTNYDKILEAVYHKFGVFLPISHPSHSELLKKCLVDHSPILYKFHGDVDEPSSIVLGKNSYNQAYELTSSLVCDLKMSLQQKHLLFLGCSLGSDRTVDMLKIFTPPGLTHYAILDCNEEDIDKRIKELGDSGIRVILYPKGMHSCLRTILKKLLFLTDPDGFKELIATENPAVLSQRFKYSEETTEFVGRSEQIEKLREFLSTEGSSALWWAIVGSGGAGKSRLAYEFIKLVRNNCLLGVYSHFDFVDSSKRKLPVIEDIKRNALIIIDYVKFYSATLGDWLVDLSRNVDSYNLTIKVLLLEREGESYDSAPWITSIEEQCTHKDIFESICYDKSFLRLTELQESDILKIMVSYASSYNKQFTSEQLNIMYSQFIMIDNRYKRPLYAMFVSDAWMNEPESAIHWGRNALLKYIVTREKSIYERILLSLNNAERRNRPLIKAFFVFKLIATALGYISVSFLCEEFPTYHTALQNASQYFNNIEDMLTCLSLADKYEDGAVILAPVEPDLIGEFFVWNLLTDKHLFSSNDLKELIDFLWNFPSKSYSFYSRLLQDFNDLIEEYNPKDTSMFIEHPNLGAMLADPRNQNHTTQYAAFLVDISQIPSKVISKKALNVLKVLSTRCIKPSRQYYTEKFADALTNYIPHASIAEVHYCVALISLLLEHYPTSSDLQYQYSIASFFLCEKVSVRHLPEKLVQIEEIISANSDSERFLVLQAHLLQHFFPNYESLKIVEHLIYCYPNNSKLTSSYDNMLIGILSDLETPHQRLNLLDSLLSIQLVNPFRSDIYCLALLAIAYSDIPYQQAMHWLDENRFDPASAHKYEPNHEILLMVSARLQQWCLVWQNLKLDYKLWYSYSLYILVLYDCNSEESARKLVDLYNYDTASDFLTNVVSSQFAALEILIPVTQKTISVFSIISEALLSNYREILNVDSEYVKATYKLASSFLFDIAMWHYSEDRFEVAYQYFEKCASIGSKTGINNMIYMLRRGEANAPINTIEHLLEELGASNDAFLHVNEALYLLSLESDDSCIRADSLIASLHDSVGVGGVVGWWSDLYAKGELEGVLVLNWLQKHELYPTYVPLNHSLLNSIRNQYPDNADWIIEQIFSKN